MAFRGSSRLTEEQVFEIHTSPEKSIALAKAYGVAPEIVRNVRRGKTYKEIKT